MARSALQNPRHRSLGPEQALKFLVEFSHVDLDAARPRQLATIDRRVKEFMNRESPGHWVIATEPNREALKLVQSRSRQVLAGIANDGRLAIAGDALLSFYVIRDGDALRVEVLGSELDRFLYQCVRVLQTTDSTRLKKCPSCGQLFIKVTKKQYCSKRCQSRVYMRAYRAGEAGGG